MNELGRFDADPELRDENDPAFKEEMFRLFRHMRWRPEDLTTDPVYAAEYAEWLKTEPPDED